MFTLHYKCKDFRYFLISYSYRTGTGNWVKNLDSEHYVAKACACLIRQCLHWRLRWIRPWQIPTLSVLVNMLPHAALNPLHVHLCNPPLWFCWFYQWKCFQLTLSHDVFQQSDLSSCYCWPSLEFFMSLLFVVLARYIVTLSERKVVTLNVNNPGLKLCSEGPKPKGKKGCISGFPYLARMSHCPSDAWHQ